MHKKDLLKASGKSFALNVQNGDGRIRRFQHNQLAFVTGNAERGIDAGGTLETMKSDVGSLASNDLFGVS